ncbi:DUF4288 domain-containing protein [Tundrisphaera sp. TA3]|uniref:DUF4288 domain-containing protein n=1 Tax=Tundrisphaera sp. TA3 TaxID=3435775 RepID=UPI003EB8420C
MESIPEDARWYLANLILEIRIEGDPRNVIHINTRLIKADTPELAYRKAVDLGRAGEMEYDNTNDKLVKCSFRGIRNLEVIQDDLEDGAELFYEEHIGIAENEIRGWAKYRDELSVFAPREKLAEVPNFMPKSIAEDLVAEGMPRTEITGWEHES